MILFLDVNKKMLSLYRDEGTINIPFQNAGELYKYTENKNFLYVTKVIETNAQEVIKLIENMGTHVKAPVKEKYSYIHVKEEGIIPIDDLLRFRGKYDVHPLTPEFIKKIEDTPLLQMLIKNGRLEMITSSRRKELKEEYEKKEDEKLNVLIVDGSVDDLLEGKNKEKSHDAIVIDLEKSGTSISGTNINTMTELLAEMEEF